MRKFPWVSLTLLLLTYGTLGWLLSAFRDPWFVWVLVVVGTLLLAESLSSSWSKTRRRFARLFKSDARTFLVAVLASFLSVFIVTWFHVSAHILVVMAAGTLFRLDAQRIGLNKRLTFWILAIVALTGLGLGALAKTAIAHHL